MFNRIKWRIIGKKIIKEMEKEINKEEKRKQSPLLKKMKKMKF